MRLSRLSVTLLIATVFGASVYWYVSRGDINQVTVTATAIRASDNVVSGFMSGLEVVLAVLLGTLALIGTVWLMFKGWSHIPHQSRKRWGLWALGIVVVAVFFWFLPFSLYEWVRTQSPVSPSSGMEIEPGSLAWVLPWLLIPVIIVMAYYTSHEPTGPFGNTGYKDRNNALRVGLITTFAVLLWQAEGFFVSLASGMGIGLSQHIATKQWLNDYIPFMGFILAIAVVWIAFWQGRYKQGAILMVFMMLGNIILNA